MKMKALLLVVVSFFIGGCAIAHKINIDNYTAKYVNRSDIGAVIGNDSNLPLVKDWTSGDFVVIEIITGSDLLELVTSMGSSLFAELYFCEQPETPVLLGIGEIYTNGDSITELRLVDKVTPSQLNRTGSSQKKYDVVMFLVWDRKRQAPVSSKSDVGQDYYLQYDLRKHPEDVCLLLRGGNLVRKLESNQIKLTKADIRKIIN